MESRTPPKENDRTAPPAEAESDGRPLGTLGDFELRREIGRGGMGTVFEAWQRSLGRVVALKVLGHHISSSTQAIQRFKREAHAAAKLHHTHITPIFAQGEDHGVYYYAMELIDGPSLHAIISEARDALNQLTPVDPAETVALSRVRGGEAGGILSSGDSTVALTRIAGRPATWEQFRDVAVHMAAIADALDYAHAQGVIHRDIKPHNLMLGSDSRMRITDFGLARVSEQPGVTMTGELVGSPLYMSPEQILEDRGSLDHRTDIYSLGATMYEWLTFRAPYPGESRERVISLIAHSEPASLRSLNPLVPVALETICLKAIERDKRRRYQTAGELRDDLRRFLLSQPIKARRASLMTRAGRLIGRHQLASMGVGAVVIAAGLTLALWSKQGEIQQKTAAVEAARQDSDQLLELFGTMMNSGLPLEVTGPIKAAEAAVPFVGKLLGGAAAPPVSDLIASDTSGTVPTAAGTPEGIARRATQDFYGAAVAAEPEAPAEDEISRLLVQARELRSTDPATALSRVDSFLAMRQNDYEALQLRAALYARLGKYPEMMKDAEALMQLRADDPVPYVWRGLARLLVNDFEQSLADLEAAGRFEQMQPWSKAITAIVMLQLGRRGDAINFLNDALTASPDLVIGLLARSLAYGGGFTNVRDSAATDAVRRAIEDLSHVIILEPLNADAITVRGQFYVLIGDFAAAVADFDLAMNMAGRTQALLFKYMMARLAQQKADASRVAESNSDAPTVELGVPPGEDVTSERVQEWFSRHVWPRTPGTEGDDSALITPSMGGRSQGS